MTRRIISMVLLTIVLVCTFLTPVNAAMSSTSVDTGVGTKYVAGTKKPDGLTVQNGKLMKGGEEFYGVGVNYFDMFTGVFSEKWDLTGVMTALENLKSYDCKVIRFSTLPFYAKDMGYYLEEEDTYWAKLDELVKKCEELEIGLIPSMFWTFSFFDYYGEPYEASIFDENSQGMAFMKEYTVKFVKRYAQSPAIYGWEFSNEKILSADIPGQEQNDTYFSTSALNHIYTIWADLVAENDPYDRIIATGDTSPRESQYNQWKFGGWYQDTWPQHKIVMDAINPGEINTVTQHQYSLGTMLNPVDKTAPLFDATTWKTFFEYLKNISSELGKACYVGEVGYSASQDIGWQNVTEEHLQSVYDSIGQAMLDTDMQMILLWNYDHQTAEVDGNVYGRGTGIEFSWNENTTWGKIALQMMEDVNEQLASLASSGTITGSGAWAYTADKVYNSEVSVKFKLSNQLEGGNWVDFALRGNSQDAGDWFSYQNGLVLRLYADPNWGTYFKVGYGGADVWFDADFGESALKYTNVDFSQKHTVSYSVQDIYDNGVFQGIRIDVKLDDTVVNFTNLNNAGYTSTSDGSYIMIPASYLESAPAEHFTGSYLFAWGNGKSIAVTEAYLEHIKENIAYSGTITGGGAWAYTDDKVYNSEVSIKFNLSAQLEGGNWIDFALRGNSQDAGDWFHYQNGLVLRLYADPNWGTYFKVGYGGGDVWFDADFGESALKYTGTDFSKEHTITYSVQDVYENDVFQGIRIDVKLDDVVVNFNTSEGSYIMIPASSVESAPDEHFTSSYLFAWANGKSITVTEAHLQHIGVNTEPEAPTEPETPTEPEESKENIASSGIMTGGGAWAYTADKVYNSDVAIKFNLSAQLQGGNWIDFALRGNCQDAGDWFHYQKGLVLRLHADPTWGTYFKVGYGGDDGWFDADFGESVLKYTSVDFSKEHTIAYSVQDVYENDVFRGIRIDVKLDDAVVNFNTSEGSYIMIPASSIESAPAEHFTESYLFAWPNGKSITVTEAYLEQLGTNDKPETPVVSQWNITLGDSIGVNFELNLAEGDTVAAFIGENEMDSVYADGKLSVKLAAAQMADEIIIKINGEALDKTYSVRGYADYILDDANGFNDSAKALVKAMLNYGAASQTYFNYNTGNLANTGIDVTAATVPTEGGKFDISGSVEGLAFYGASLVHKDKIAVRFYFTGSVDGIDFGAYTVNENNGMYYIEIADINPQDMDKDVTVTVNNSLTISYSPLDYIIRMYAKGGNSAALVQALYGYYLAAASYTTA